MDEPPRTSAQWDELEKAYHILRRDNIALTTTNKSLRGKVAGLMERIRLLTQDLESFKAAKRIPLLTVGEEAVRNIFPSFPNLQYRSQQILLALWNHYSARQDSTLIVPDYLSRHALHQSLWGHREAPPTIEGISVHIHNLRKSIKDSPFRIETKVNAGVRLVSKKSLLEKDNDTTT